MVYRHLEAHVHLFLDSHRHQRSTGTIFGICIRLGVVGVLRVAASDGGFHSRRRVLRLRGCHQP